MSYKIERYLILAFAISLLVISVAALCKDAYNVTSIAAAFSLILFVEVFYPTRKSNRHKRGN